MFFFLLRRAEFLKESSLSKSESSKTSILPEGGESGSSSTELSVASAVPKIRPYSRKRGRDSNDDLTHTNASSSGVSEDSGVLSQAQSISEDSDSSTIEVKPYVRKRKIKTKL